MAVSDIAHDAHCVRCALDCTLYDGSAVARPTKSTRMACTNTELHKRRECARHMQWSWGCFVARANPFLLTGIRGLRSSAHQSVIRVCMLVGASL
jgi:hypothetical protein